MFSKKTGYSPKRETTTPWRWSVTRRLVISYTLSAFAMLVITAMFFNWTVNATLLKGENDYIDDRLHVYRAIIEGRPDFLDVIRQDIKWEGAYVKFPEYYVRILDTQCRTLIETSRMSELIPSRQFFDPCETGTDAQKKARSLRHTVSQSMNGRTFVLENYWVKAASPSRRFAIQIAVDITGQKEIIQNNQQRMILIILLSIGFAVLFSIVVARRVLSPLNEMAGFARRITIDKISMRDTDPLRWPVELRALAIAFNEMLERLKNSFTRLSEYTSDLAHELRTPINILMGEAEVALTQERTAQEYRMVLESGLEEHMRLSRMIDSLLFLARAEHSVKIERSLFDPLEEIKKVCSFYEALAEEKQASISWGVSCLINGDFSLFRRVMSNLISNALYYAPVGVKIEISGRQTENFIEVRVSDTGYGLSEEDSNKIFDRFYRVMSSRSYNPHGSGLGLSIVKSIMDLHNGTITLTSMPGQGTTVILRFPC